MKKYMGQRVVLITLSCFHCPLMSGQKVAGREKGGNFQILMLSGEVGCRGKAKAKEGGVVCHQVGCGGCFA